MDRRNETASVKTSASVSPDPVGQSPCVLFIIPLIAKANCSDWPGVCSRLQDTLDCIRNQTSSQWHVFLVCNEPPKLQADDARITILCSEFCLKNSNPGARSLDKERKLQFGMIHAAKINPRYIMFLDGDDRISNQLVDFVARRPQSDGFLITTGYLYRAGSRWLVRLNRFHMSCGSCYLFRYRKEEAPTRMDQPLGDFWMLKAHNKHVLSGFRDRQESCTVVPFPAGVYFRGHGDSIRDLFGRRQQGGGRMMGRGLVDQIRKAVRFCLRATRVTTAIERVFGTLR